MYYSEKKLYMLFFTSFCVLGMQMTSEELIKFPIYQIRALLPMQDGSAEYLIGVKLLHGVGVPNNVSAALNQFNKAIEKGNKDAYYILAQVYKTGSGVPRDEKKALEFMEKAAIAGVSAAQYSLGHMYMTGFVVPINLKLGLEWIRKAAHQGNANALATLGIYARQGFSDLGEKIEPDLKKALELFKAAAAGKSFIGIYNLAQFYQSGLEGERNPAQAKKLFDIILTSENEDAFPYKALLYETGIGTDKDINKAKKYYEILVEKNAGSMAIKGLARVNKKIEEKARQKLEADKFAAEEFLKKTKKNKIKKKSMTSQTEVSSESESEEEPTHDIEQKKLTTIISLTGDTAQEALNSALSYKDSSVIIAMDLRHGIITIKNPYNDSTVTVRIDKEKKSITGKAIKSLKKFTYDDRVAKWFGSEEELLRKYSPEEIARHRFAQRVDEIIQLYGNKAIFIKDDGTLEKSKVLVGDIVTKNGKKLQGTFEYSYYKNQMETRVLYHRFLHPNSRTVII